MTLLAFLDSETTGLDVERHEVWEVAVVLRQIFDEGPSGNVADVEYVWQLPVDVTKADPMALRIGQYWQRRWPDAEPAWLPAPFRVHSTEKYVVHERQMGRWAEGFCRLTDGAHIFGAVPSFDTVRLERLLRGWGACPTWHYHPHDVEDIAAGAIHGARGMMNGLETAASLDRLIGERVKMPLNTDALFNYFGVHVPEGDRHTALGDARACRDLYDAVCDYETEAARGRIDGEAAADAAVIPPNPAPHRFS